MTKIFLDTEFTGLRQGTNLKKLSSYKVYLVDKKL